MQFYIFGKNVPSRGGARGYKVSRIFRMERLTPDFIEAGQLTTGEWSFRNF